MDIMERWFRVGLVLLASVAATSQAQDPASPFAPWTGTYHAVDFADQRPMIEGAIDAGTAEMGPMRRSVARRRLRRVNEPIHVLRLFTERDRFVIEVDGFRFPAPLDGSWTRTTDPFGDRLRLSCRIHADVVRCRFVGEDGEKHIDFRLGPTNRLTLAVSLISDRLPDVIRFRLPFARD